MTSAKRTCHKRRFDNEYAVGKWLKRIHANNSPYGGNKMPLRWYYHPDCDGYHVTSRPDRVEELSGS